MTQHDSSQVDRLSSQRVKDLLAIGTLEAGGDRQADSLAASLVAFITHGSKDELQQLNSDLKQPVISSDDGPLSFGRLTGLPTDQSKALVNQSFLRALTSSRTTSSELERLAKYGVILTSSQMPTSTRHTGKVIQLLAVAALVARNKRELSDAEQGEVFSLLDAMQRSVAVPNPLREYATQTNPKIVDE